MKILLIGASGMIGSHILREASKRGHEIIAASRNPEKIDAADGVSAVALDISDVDAVAEQAGNVDVIVTAVSPRSTGDATPEAEANGKALIEAAEKSGKRLLMVGGAGSLKTPDGGLVLDNLPDFIKPEATGMRNVYLALQDSGIDWTFFAPPPLIVPGEAKGSFRLGGDTLVVGEDGSSTVTAGDYAVALVNELEKPEYKGQIFTVAY